jgi:hypothetical protein
MDFQVAFNLAMSFIFIGTGWAIRAIYDGMNNLKKDQIALEREVASVYVRREDYRQDIVEIKQILSQIFNKLDNKADKNG